MNDPQQALLAQQQYDTAQALHRQGRLAEAERHYQAVLDLTGDHPGVLLRLGHVLDALGRREEAVVQFEKVLALEPDHTATLNNLGNALVKLGRTERGIECFERALAVTPGFILARSNLGTVLAKLGRHQEAVVQFEKVLALKPGHAAALSNLGNSLNALGRPVEALGAFERALAADPELAEAAYGAGSVLLQLGRFDEARAAFERAVALKPRRLLFHRLLASVKHFSEGDPQLEAMEALTREISSFAANEQIDLHFALAKAYDDLKRHKPAFGHLQKGNALKRATIDYDEAAQLGAMAAIACEYTPEAMDERRGCGHPSDVPVFIVGMPRSGTTLVEQMLASHPQVFGAGELDYFAECVMAQNESTPGNPIFSGASLGRIGERYAAKLRALAPNAARIVDKAPGNFIYAGPIHLALPKARIIHMRRDPADTCFSCYSQLFTHGHGYAYDLGECGRHYKAYEALMAHWRTTLPEGAMLEVQYENLVSDFEAEARRIVDYCGLEWRAECLAFHKTERPVQTASVVQVRMPLYRSSIGRWRPYAEWLHPLFDALEGV